MQRPSVYSYTIKEPLASTFIASVMSRGWSLRDLADKCRPPLDHSTIRRIERNEGFTHDCLKRVARALDVTVPELFVPRVSAQVTNCGVCAAR